ncbi:MAG TPA: SRPBCC family protein [Oculatellaceae cyanobacterium]
MLPPSPKRPSFWLTKLFLCVGVVIAAQLVNTSFADSAEWPLLQQGKVSVRQNISSGNTIPSVEAKILINRSPDKVWPIVANPEKLMSQEDKVKKVKILSQTGNTQQVAFSVFMTKLLPTFNYILEQNLSPPYVVRFHRLSGSFRDIQGFWRLIPADNGQKTILVYNLKLDPGPLVPRSMLLGAIKADLPNMMQSVKKTIELNSN